MIRLLAIMLALAVVVTGMPSTSCAQVADSGGGEEFNNVASSSSSDGDDDAEKFLVGLFAVVIIVLGIVAFQSDWDRMFGKDPSSPAYAIDLSPEALEELRKIEESSAQPLEFEVAAEQGIEMRVRF